MVESTIGFIQSVSFLEEPETEEPWPSLNSSPINTQPPSQQLSSSSSSSASSSFVTSSSMSPWTKRLFGPSPSPIPVRLPSVKKPAIFASHQETTTPTIQTTAAPSSSSLSSAASSTFSSTSDSSSSSVSIVLLDSGSFINGCNLSHFGSSCCYLTISQVVAELKDSVSQHRFNTFPYPIIQRQPSAEALHIISTFAKATGDYSSLSTTDLLFIALCWQVERETNGMKFLKTEPIRLDTALVQSFIKQKNTDPSAAFSSIHTSSPSPAAPDSQVNDSHLYDEWKSDDEQEEENDDEGGADEENADLSEQKEETKSDSPAISPVNDDGEGQWITSGNLHTQNQWTGQLESDQLKEESTVACITTDYAMQNVLLQLGVRLLSIAGLSISGIRHWLRKCHSCNTFTRDLEREFCPSCGNHTMIRVTVVVDRDSLSGNVSLRVFHGTRHLNLRGTRFSIPRPKGGRTGQPMKLSEDVMPHFGHSAKQKTNSPTQLFDAALEFGVTATGKQKKQEVYGYGKRNPNVVAKKTGNRRRKR